MNDLWTNLLADLLVTIILVGLKQVRDRFLPILSRHDPRLLSGSFALLPIAWILLNAGVVCYVVIQDQSNWLLISVFFVSSIIMLLIFWNELQQFWSVGIRGADQQIAKGIDYHKSLKLCQDELKFLGIGAAKLTSDSEFEAALGRCKQKPIKFLLCDPGSHWLREAARQYDKDENAYKQVAIESLRKIAHYKTKRDFNIEVRFYSDKPLLRLMFIDNSICLFSYNLLGEGDGSQLPQLHIAKSTPRRAANTFYYPFESYFDNLWDKCKQNTWNFQSHPE